MTADLFDLTGKIALVTGGSRGLGAEMVRAFAQHGADVVITSRKQDACDAMAAEIRGTFGRRALAAPAHVGRWPDIDALIARIYAEWGRIDILVNNAGMGPAMPSQDVTEELFDKIIGLNFKGPFRLASVIGHRMAQGAGGCIINISSTGALMPLPGVVPYSAAKAALNAITLSLAHELAPKVRVNTISAGPFLTDISKAWPEAARRKQPNAAGRPGQPHEIITSALYLASPASSYTTGALLRVDGGTW